MKALRFRLEGKTAFFKKPDVNSFAYFTYGHIHKVALLGMLGAILGYRGYNQMRNETYPEFYEKLMDLKVSIVPNNDKGIISKKIQTYNNSTGYACEEKSGNLIVREQWLESPSWDIYVLINSDVSKKIAESLTSNKSIFIPYLGKNNHFANISNVALLEINSVSELDTKISSFFIKNSLKIVRNEEVDDFDEEQELIFKYEEKLPVALCNELNSYILETLIYTNNKVKISSSKDVYKIEDKYLQFI